MCEHLSRIYSRLWIDEKIKITERFLSNLETLSNDVMSFSFEQIGYWTAQMEVRKRNVQNVSQRTKFREMNKIELKKLIEKHHHKINNDMIADAIKITNRGERTVKNLINEIIYEKDMKKEV